MKSAMVHNFANVPRADIPRSAFNRSSRYKTTFDSGWLIPMFVDEVLPGDTLSMDMEFFCRMATPAVPIMDNVYVDIQFLEVPNRLTWANWQRMNGEKDNPSDSTDFLVPQITAPAGTGFVVGSIYDYMGIPTGIPGLKVNALPLRAYMLCYNEWYRDQNLQNSIVVQKGDGPDLPQFATLQKRGKRHDYFTSCLPWPQKGPAVPIPINVPSTVPVTSNGLQPNVTTPQFNNRGVWISNQAGVNQIYGADPAMSGASALTWGNQTGMQASLTTVTGGTINALRQAFQLQKLYERDARGGTRYIEVIRSHFGVVSPDARMQRPEYLGGTSRPIYMHPVPQNSASDDATTPQGNLAAFATSSGNARFTKSFVEHGFVLGLVSVRADLTYQQGLNRMWSRRSRFDYYWPALSNIGEQAVLNKEIFAQGNATDDQVFGYQERYGEYRFKPSLITGKFRSTAAGSLDVWHLSQKFESLPLLNNVFIEEAPPIDRVIAVTDEPEFLIDIDFNARWVRPMPMYAVPGLVDHF